MFRDGRRRIDMVLCYEEENEGVMTEMEAKRREARKTFLENLVKDGLELEIEDKSHAFDEKTYFVKIHLPWKSEMRYAEVLNLKLPVKRFITISVKAWVQFTVSYNFELELVFFFFNVNFPTTSYSLILSSFPVTLNVNVKNQIQMVMLCIVCFFLLFLHLKNQKDEDRKSVIELGVWRTILEYWRKLNTYHELAVEGEATYSSANANGNAEEQ